MRVYLAGPDVFHPSAVEIGRKKREICQQFGLEGLFPLDNEVSSSLPPQQRGQTIFDGNCAMMDRADAGIFNLTPFRSPGVDSGTAFELGYLYARGKPCFGYAVGSPDFEARTRAMVAAVEAARIAAFDPSYAVEPFALSDNLMIDRAIMNSTGILVYGDFGGDRRRQRDDWCALSVFSACVAQMVQTLAAE